MTKKFSFLSPVLFLYCGEAGQFITFCEKYILPLKEKVTFQLELVSTGV